MNDENSKMRKKVKSCVYAFLIMALLVTAFLIINDKTSMRRIRLMQVGSKGVHTMKYDELEKKLRELGYSNITATALDDLSADEEGECGMVGRMKLDNGHVLKNSLNDLQRYPLDGKIEIEYHSMQQISPPVSSEDIINNGYDYHDLEKVFKDAGFVNIRVKPWHILVTAGTKDIGRVVGARIGTDEEFSLNSKFDLNEEVVIAYLDFKQ